MKKVIQIVEFGTEKVVHEVNVEGHSEKQIDRIDSGMNINLNHSQYFTRLLEE